jgi:hypothetical protein
MSKPEWIDYSACDGPRIIFQWTKERRAQYPGYDAAGLAPFPETVIAGAVYATADEARDWADEPLGETGFFANWNDAVKWLVDPAGPYFPLGFPNEEMADV